MNIKYLGVGIAIGVVIGAGGLYLVLSQEIQNKSILTSEQKLNENTELKQTETEKGQETKIISFPYSWVKDNIKITIYGIVPGDRYSPGEYYIPITYENLLKESYKPPKGFTGGFDNIRLETDKGNIWDVETILVRGIAGGYKFDPQQKISFDDRILFSINGDENPQNVLLTIDGKTYTIKARPTSFEELEKQGFW